MLKTVSGQPVGDDYDRRRTIESTEDLGEPETQRGLHSVRLGVTVLPEPPHRFFKRDVHRRLRKTEFSDGFIGIVMHLVFGHLHTLKRMPF